MRNLLFLLLFFVFISHGNSQVKPDRNGHLIGYIKKSDLLNLKSKDWFKHSDYKPSEKVIRKIKKSLKGINVKAFVGTWCHDSKREIPRLYKIMGLAEFDIDKNFQIIGISRGKKTPDNLQEGYNIKRTPTIIFFKEGKEIGRYVEHARETLEKDILKILKSKNYKHSYQN